MFSPLVGEMAGRPEGGLSRPPPSWKRLSKNVMLRLYDGPCRAAAMLRPNSLGKSRFVRTREVWASGPLILFRVMLQSGNENFEPVLDSPHGHPYLRLR